MVTLESGLKAHFLFLGCGLMRRTDALEKVISPIVEGMSFQWIGIQYFPQGRRSILRLFIDKPGGVSIDDIAKVSRQVNAALSVETLITEEYTLEVSSPGLDRVLFTPAQCSDHIGKLVSIRLVVPIEGKRNFKGRLHNVEGDRICILLEDGEKTFSFPDVDEARLVPEW